ncbi:MAG: hypothetical protein DMG50_28540 [Acidobacteria bacterium]|nr:MAG: hypothetical protein DMG50_28540 [Acidobacteriota bacterium]
MSTVAAQEKPAAPDRSSAQSTGRPLPSKKQPAQVEPDEQQQLSTPGAPANEADGPEAIRKRAEWFYKQRASVGGHIPSGARLKAFQQMRQMMFREGKLTLRPDGSYTEVSPQSSPSPLGAVTSTWTPMGPTPTTGGFFSPVTGRVATIAVDPSDSTGDTVLIGGAMGGIWRSTDAGATWTPVGDQNASLAMGSIAFAPSNHSTVYAATGESESVAFDIYYGAGVLKSTDGGLHWTQTCTVASSTCPFIGPYNDITPFGFFTLGGTRITYVAVSPSNPQMVLVAAQTQFAQGTTEGVYCSDNGGSTWTNILPDQLASFVGFASSTVAYAALGNPFGSSANAPDGNGIYKATSVGSTCSTVHFSRLTSTALPLQSTIGRIDLGIAPSDTSGNTVYASIADSRNASETNLGVFVTTNGGSSWTQTAAPDICHFQCWYDNVVKVDPNNNSIVFFGGGAVRDSSGNPSWVVRTTNGGTSWSSVIPNLPGGSAGLPHVDNHAIAFVKLPTGKVRMYLGNDGGMWRTDDAEATPVTWTNLNNPRLTLTQFYPFISINASQPAISFGGTQDNGSQNFQGGTAWVDNQQCGDGGTTAVDSVIPSTVYIGCITGFPVNASYQNGAIGTFFPAINGINPNDFIGILPPLATDPSSANVVYFGTTKVYQSVDAGNTWTPISNDLVSGFNFDSLNVIAVAPANPAVVYVGANTGNSAGQLTGLVFAATNVTPGNFTNFFQVSGQILLPPRALTAIAVDPADTTGMTAYVTFSGFSFVFSSSNFNVNDPTGHIFKTTDGGATWNDVSCSVAVCTTPAATDLPNIPVNDLVIDPDVPGTLYAATDLGVFVGNCSSSPCTWSTLSTGLPRVVVHSLRLHEPSRTLRAGTHGRGAWDINLNNFSFMGPHISSLSPASISAGAASLTLTVNGSGLTNGSVQWNGSLTGVATTQVSDTQLTASIAASLLAAAGTTKINVVNGTQTSNSLTLAILAGTPTITSISPPSAPVQTAPATPSQIQLTGTNFSNNAKVLFNGARNGITVAAPTPSCQPPTCITATLPAALLGPFGSTDSISVSNLPPGGGQSNLITFQVVAPPPPNDNFANAINIIPYTFGDGQDSSGATTESTDPTPPCVQQSQGNTGGHPNGAYNSIWYKFTPVVSAGLNVDSINSSYDTVLSVWSGSPGSFVNVACNDDIIPGVNIQSQLLNVQLAAGTTYYIMVSSFGPPDPNPIALGGGTFFHFSFNGGLTPAPTITTISPTSANSGDPNFTLTVNGSGFLNGAIVDFNNSTTFRGTALPSTFVSSTQLTAVVPASAITLPGPFTINVLNPVPTVGPSNFVNFTVNLGVYPVPTLGSINPSTIIAGSLPFNIIAACQDCASVAVLNFNSVSKPSTVSNSFSFPYPQNVNATISTADISTAATVQVTVSNPPPGGGSSAPLPFVITQPTVVPNITSVNRATFPAGLTQGAALNVGGTGGVYFSTTFVTSTQLSVGGVVVNNVGTFPMYVIDPAPGGTSGAFNVTVTQPPPPTIISISPSSAQSGSFPTLTINGTDFQHGATVMLNNTTFPVNVLSTTQLAAFVSLGGVAAGTYPLTVVNPIPTPTTSNAVNFTVTPPPDFSMTSTGTTTQTINAGQTATFTNAISVAAQNGFSSPVDLFCSLPSSATYTTCAVSPSLFPNGSGTATVSITTTARGLLPPSLPFYRFYLRPELVALLLLTLLLAILMLRLTRTHRVRIVGALPLAALVLFILLQVIGCGGGGSSTPPPPPPPTGTPAGTYTVTVTGSTGTLTHSTTLTLTVN